jgi:hypothetical protein
LSRHCLELALLSIARNLQPSSRDIKVSQGWEGGVLLFFFNIQGWIVKLSPEMDWLLYLGSPGYSFPSFSPTTKMNEFTLKKNTSSYISFKREKYVRLARRGYFDTEDHCTENIQLSDTITCFKKCFLDRLQV